MIKYLFRWISLLTFVLSNVNGCYSFAQNAGERTYATIAPGLSASRNYVKNPSGYKNALNVTVSSASIARDTDTADKLDGIASLVCDASAQNGYCLFSLNTIQEGDKTGNCEAKVTYKGDASLYKLTITDTSSTLSSSSVLQNSTDWTDVSINYPCGSSRDVRFVQTESGTGAAVNVGRVYYGKATNVTMEGSTSSTIQKFTSSSGTYTTPTNVLYIKVTMVGGGGGGGGGGTVGTGGNGGAGGSSTFGTSLLTANGGSLGGAAGASGGAGGSYTISSPASGQGVAGGSGAGGMVNSGVAVYLSGGSGGTSPLGGNGLAGYYAATGGAGTTNTGSGGAGGNINTTGTFYSGAGGGAGGFIHGAIIPSPSGTYAYSVGAAGTAGTAGTNGSAGGAGGSGLIIVEEFYKTSSAVSVSTNSFFTDWQTCTVTGGWSTNTTYTGKCKRSADQLDMDVNVALSGAPNSADLTINLPSTFCSGAQCTIDTTKMASSGVELTQLKNSSGGISDAGSRVASTMAYYNSTTSIVVIADNSTTSPGKVNATTPITFANTDSVNIKFSVPIVGWTSPQAPVPILVGSISSAATGALRIESAYIVNTAGTPAVSTSTSSWISSVTDSGTGNYGLNLVSGMFSSAPYCNWNCQTADAIPVVNATSTSSITITCDDANSAGRIDANGYITCIGPR
jgi:hypothetical protein